MPIPIPPTANTSPSLENPARTFHGKATSLCPNWTCPTKRCVARCAQQSLVDKACLRINACTPVSPPRKVRKMLYVGKDCMLRHWMRPPYNADGWRLDAIHMIGTRKGSDLGPRIHDEVDGQSALVSNIFPSGEGRTAFNNAEHVRQIRKSIRAERADALCMGEHVG